MFVHVSSRESTRIPSVHRTKHVGHLGVFVHPSAKANVCPVYVYPAEARLKKRTCGTGAWVVGKKKGTGQ